MPDDIKAMLGGAKHALTSMRDIHGNLSAKLSPFELLHLGILGAEKAHEIFTASGGGHAGAGEYEPLLAAPMFEAEQRLIRIAQVTSAQEFDRYANDLADYGASLSDPVKRKRVGMFLLILGRARGSMDTVQHAMPPGPQPCQRPGCPQSGYGSGYDSSYAPPSGAPQWHPAPMQALEPPHPHEAHFQPYLSLGAREGWQAMRAGLSKLDREGVKTVAQALREYAASLRNPEAIKAAIALSNNLAVEFASRFGNAQAALPAPARSRST
jgi:hypothetical protein